MLNEIENIEVKDIGTDEAPNEKWSLDQLGEFCKDKSQRMAKDAWMVGKALTLAKNRCQGDGASFTDFKRNHGFSDATASRYMRLYENDPSDAGCNQLAKIGIMEALETAGISKKRSQPIETRNLSLESSGTTTGSKNNEPSVITPKPSSSKSSPLAAQVVQRNATLPSWAVEDEEDDPSPLEDPEDDLEVCSVGESLEYECREMMQAQVEQLSEKLEMLLALDDLQNALPPKKGERQKVLDKVVVLEEQLVKLKDALLGEAEMVATAAT